MPAQFTAGRFKAWSDSGVPLANARLYTYDSGTTTQKNAFTNAGLGTPCTYTSDGGGGQYIAMDSRGEAQLWLGTGAYTLTLKTSVGGTIYSVDGVTSEALALQTLMISSTGSTLMSYNAGGTGSVTNLLSNKLKAMKDGVDFGGSQDGSTDATTALVALANDAIAMGRNTVMIPPNTKFSYATLMATAPTGVTFINFSGINDFSSGGSTTRIVSIIGTSVAANDLHLALEDAHHPTLTGNNFGTGGSTSATNALFSVLWARNKFTLGASNARGYRGCAILQFRKESSTTWSYGLRSLAPWVSINGLYEPWETNKVISGAGVYRFNDTNHYVSTGAGTTGATAPTHTSGTVSDGGVSWTYVDSTDRGIFLVDQYGHWLIGNGSLNSTWRHKVTPTDPTQAYVGELVAGGISQSASLKLTPTNGAGNEVLQPFLQGNTNGLSVLKSDGSSSLITVADTGSTFAAIGSTSATPDTATGATPSVSNRNTYYIGNAGAQSITGFTNGFDGQRVRVIVTNANTSFTHSATFNLAGSTNLATPAAFSVIDFEKVPASISDRWIETGRSLK